MTMQKKYIEDENGNKVLPITHFSAVKNSSGDTLDDVLYTESTYDPTQYSGMGRKVLQKNMVNGVNTLTQDMMPVATGGNTIYIIRYDFTLGEDITVPANCVLEFDGGSISGNHTLTGQNTDIIAAKKIIFGCHISGTWVVSNIYEEWFDWGDKSECFAVMQNMMNLQNDNVYQAIYLMDSYKWTPTSNADRDLIKLSSNTVLHFSNIQVKPNTVIGGSVINITGKSNVVVEGGVLVGDNGNPDRHYDQQSANHIIGADGIAIFQTSDANDNVQRSENILIKNVTSRLQSEDGLYIGSHYGPTQEDINLLYGCKNIVIENCKFDDNARQAMSVTTTIDGLFIDNCSFINTGQTAFTPLGYGIDFERNTLYDKLRNIQITDCVFKNNLGDDIGFQNYFSGTSVGCAVVNICNCHFEPRSGKSSQGNYDIIKKSMHFIGGFRDVTINNCILGEIEIDSQANAITDTDNPIIIRNCNIASVADYARNLDANKTYFCANIVFENCNIGYKKTGIDWHPGILYLHAKGSIIFRDCMIDATDMYASGSIFPTGAFNKVDLEFYNCELKLHLPQEVVKICNCNIYGYIGWYSDDENRTLYVADSTFKDSNLRDNADDNVNTAYIYYVGKNWIPTNVIIKNCVFEATQKIAQIFNFEGQSRPQPHFVMENNTYPIGFDVKGNYNAIVAKEVGTMEYRDGKGEIDPTSGKPLWFNGTSWVDATGTPV